MSYVIQFTCFLQLYSFYISLELHSVSFYIALILFSFLVFPFLLILPSFITDAFFYILYCLPSHALLLIVSLLAFYLASLVFSSQLILSALHNSINLCLLQPISNFYLYFCQSSLPLIFVSSNLSLFSIKSLCLL